jgi:hypothetical protein
MANLKSPKQKARIPDQSQTTDETRARDSDPLERSVRHLETPEKDEDVLGVNVDQLIDRRAEKGSRKAG